MVARLRPAGSRNSFTLFLCIVPFLILAFLFSYLPLYGWVYSLYDYKPALGIEGSEFVGLQWFEMLVSSPTQMAQIGQVLMNTLAISFLGIATSILPLFFAILLNEVRAPWFRSSVQTLTALPNFISWVLVYMIAFSLFSSSGLVNDVLDDAGLITAPMKFLDTRPERLDHHDALEHLEGPGLGRDHLPRLDRRHRPVAVRVGADRRRRAASS